jgi:hypothetical protein
VDKFKCHEKKERRRRRIIIIIIMITRYDYNLTIMKSPNRPPTTGLKNKLKATFEIEQC